MSDVTSEGTGVAKLSERSRAGDAICTEEQPQVVSRVPSTGRRWAPRLGLALLPVLAIALACAAGFFKWQSAAIGEARAAGQEAVQAANDTIVAILSYTPDNVDQDLHAAADRLTGTFRDSYLSLINETVIPGSTQKRISASARVAAAAPVSAEDERAVVLVFVDQTITMAADPPTDTASSVRVTLDKVDGRWLISDFTPV